MKIGFISYWFNRGQAVITRYIRKSFDERGYETFVLARPAPERELIPHVIRNDDVWNQDRITIASSNNPDVEEIITWAKKENLDVVFCYQFYGFNALKALRKMGVRVIGGFVWEGFNSKHVNDAKKAFDIIYSYTKSEQDRYYDMGLETPYIPFGCFPDLSPMENNKFQYITFIYSGGFLSRRRPTGAIIDAFMNCKSPDIRLIVKTQRPFVKTDFIKPETQIDVKQRKKFYPWADQAVRDCESLDPRIKIITDDTDHSTYIELLSRSHVLLAPSRWEGLGVHLFEATALGIPAIANDIKPINEIIKHGTNGILVSSKKLGYNKTNIATYEPEVAGLVNAMDTLSDKSEINKLGEGAYKVAKSRKWSNTIDALEALAVHQ